MFPITTKLANEHTAIWWSNLQLRHTFPPLTPLVKYAHDTMWHQPYGILHTTLSMDSLSLSLLHFAVMFNVAYYDISERYL